MLDYGTNLALFAPSGFPQLSVLIRREFQPYAAPPVRNRVIEGLAVFERHSHAPTFGQFKQFCGVTQNELARQRRFQILLEELTMPS